MKGLVGKILAVLIVAGLMTHGACEHCYASQRPACHGGGQAGSGRDHGAPRSDPSDCSCIRHLCGLPQTGRSAIASAGRSISRAMTIVAVSVAIPVHMTQTGTGLRRRGRVLPEPRSGPLYLTQHSLLI